MDAESPKAVGCVSFEIPGRIGGKGRPRFVRSTGVAYTPAKTRSEEAMIRQLGALAMRGRPLLRGPVALSVLVEIMIPKSWPKKKRDAAQYVTVRPDFDNQIKAISDSCNGIVWSDDSQIAVISASRIYVRDGPERVCVSITEIGRR